MYTILCHSSVYAAGYDLQTGQWTLAGCRSCCVCVAYTSVGPISVASGCFPLSNVLANIAKLFISRSL
jgi:hypothetical protein